MKADRLAGIVVAAAGIAGLLATARVDVIAGGNELSARFFPYLLTGGLALGGLALALRPGEMRLSGVREKLLDPRGLGFAGLFVLYAVTFRHVDFRLGTFVFVLAAMGIMGERRPIVLVLTSVLVSAATYLLFRYAFTVVLPTWN